MHKTVMKGFRLRHCRFVHFHPLCMFLPYFTKTEISVPQMASKTGRTWLDCKQPKLADVFLSMAVSVRMNAKKLTLHVCQKWKRYGHIKIYWSVENTGIWIIYSDSKNKKQMLLSQSLETLYSRLTSHGDCAEDIYTPKGDIEKDLLRVLSYQAESVSSDCLACAVTIKPKIMSKYSKTSGSNVHIYAYIYSLREYSASSSSSFLKLHKYVYLFSKFKLFCVYSL